MTAAVTASSGMSIYLTVMEQLIAKMSLHPAKLLGLNKGWIGMGADADLTIFDPNEETPDFHTRHYTRKDTSIADYVWLPVEFEGEVPVIRWYDEWRWEDFD